MTPQQEHLETAADYETTAAWLTDNGLHNEAEYLLTLADEWHEQASKGGRGMREPKFPTWKYRLFRLRYVDWCGDDVHDFGVSYYPNGDRTQPYGAAQLGIMFGAHEAVFDLKPWWKR